MKSKRRKAGLLLILTGLLLLASALCFAGYNFSEEQRVKGETQKVLAAVSAQLPKAQTDEQSADGRLLEAVPDYELAPEMEMPQVAVEGEGYIGILDLPGLNLSLPVLGEWSYPGLRTAPCRFYGSAYTGDLVIVAHNYRAHFGRLSSMAYGDQVYFTDAAGNRFAYTVAEITVLAPTDLDQLLEEGWDLTLVTCTFGGRSRVVVRCVQAD